MCAHGFILPFVLTISSEENLKIRLFFFFFFGFIHYFMLCKVEMTYWNLMNDNFYFM